MLKCSKWMHAGIELIDRALRFSASAHRGQKRMSGEDFVSHSIAVAHDPGRAAPRHHLDRRGAAPRCGRRLRRPDRGHRPRVRGRGRRAGRRPHQDLPPDLPLDRRRAGRELPEAAALDRQGRAGHHHQAGRPAAQHADAGASPAGAARAGSPPRPGRSTRRWRTGSAWPASRRSWKTWRSSSWSRRNTAAWPARWPPSGPSGSR